jgi:hypothetical protein
MGKPRRGDITLAAGAGQSVTVIRGSWRRLKGDVWSEVGAPAAEPWERGPRPAREGPV